MSRPTQSMSQYERMTTTPVLPLIVQLSIPTIISMLVTSIYNMADTAFVGQLGNSASGAVGVVFGFMAILQAVGFMFGHGSGSIISRMLGAKDADGASEIGSTGFFCALAAGALLSVVGFLTLDSLVMLLGSTETIAPYAKTYISFILLASPFMTASFTLNNVLRYEGKAFLGMIGLLTGSILNICADPLFIFVFHMGIAGAGLATAMSQTISFSILLSMFLRGKTQCKISIRLFTHDPMKIFNIMATGFPSLLRQGLGSITTVLLNSCAGVYGDAAVAAVSIVSRINMFVFSFALGIGQGFQPVSGFNYGAGKFSRVRQAFRVTNVLATGLMVVLAGSVMLASGQIIHVFRDDPTVIEIATRALRLHCLSLMVLPFGMTCEMLFQSTGQKLGASILSSLRGGVFFAPLLIILSQVRGLAGIQEAQPLANVLATIPALVFVMWFFHALPREDRT